MITRRRSPSAYRRFRSATCQGTIMKNARGFVPWVLGGLLAVAACAGDTSLQEDLEAQDGGTEDIETIMSELTVAQRVLTFERVSGTPSLSDWILGPGSTGTISS